MFKPMKLTDVGTTPEVLEQYLMDPLWIMQQKFDGARMVTIWKHGEDAVFVNGGGSAMNFSAAKLRLGDIEASLNTALEDRPFAELVLDGELIIETGEYIVFDLLMARTHDGETVLSGATQLLARIAGLNTLFEMLGPVPHLRVTPTAYYEHEKRELWQAAINAGVEGTVSKHVDSTYAPGARSRDWVKHKLVKTADVIVRNPTRRFKENGVVSHGNAELVVKIGIGEDPQPWRTAQGHRRSHDDLEQQAKRRATVKTAAELGWTYDPREELSVGAASLIGKDLSIEDGDVVEVNYLYATPDSQLIQPRIVRKRLDKTPNECRLDQFPAYTRDVAWDQPSYDAAEG